MTKKFVWRWALPSSSVIERPDLREHRAEWPLQRDPYPLESLIPNVLVAADARHGSIKRVASAVGEGSMATQLMHRCLRAHL